MDPLYKLPRLYVETLPDTAAEGRALLMPEQAHYLKNVLRCAVGDPVRVFHPGSGEYVAALGEGDRKSGLPCVLDKRVREPAMVMRRVHLYAPPLVKDRMDFLIEKATELGMTDFHPIVCERSQLRAVNNDRLRKQMIEATEQCERLDLPVLHPIGTLAKGLAAAEGTSLAALERMEVAVPASFPDGDVSIFIGPPGGWSESERTLLLTKARPLSLGANVLRAETAALSALAALQIVQRAVSP